MVMHMLHSIYFRFFIFDLFRSTSDFYPNGGRAHQPGCKNMWLEISGKEFHIFFRFC